MSAQFASTAEAFSGEEACLLAQTGVYQEYLSIRPIEALPGSHDLVVRSRLESARDPGVLQTRYRAGVDLEALTRLHRYLGDYLSSQGVNVGRQGPGPQDVAVSQGKAGEGVQS